MRPAGDDLITLDVADAKSAQSLSEALRENGRWIDVVPGMDTVVVQFDPTSLSHSDAIRILSASINCGIERPSPCTGVVEIPVAYGGEHGPDFDKVCEKLALSPAQFIALHSGEYSVDMLGFVPGFAYIGGLPDRLSIDRLAAPRQRVRAGSIGIAGTQSGLYSLAGPGGWPLVGRTSVQLFDPTVREPFLVKPGTKVVFKPVQAL